MDLTLKKFDPSQIAPNRILVVIAKRGSGKSFLTRDLMYHQRGVPSGVCFSATEESNEFWSSHIPDLFVFSKWDKEVVGRVIDRQKARKKEARRVGGRAAEIPPAFIIADDCAYDTNLTKGDEIRSLFFNGRHFNILFLLTLQYAMDIPPSLRSNIDYVFVLRENIVQNRERLYKNFFGNFPTFEAFCETLDACTENYECLVLDNTVQSNKISDCVFWYKAEDHGDFVIGDESFWSHHRNRYNANC